MEASLIALASFAAVPALLRGFGVHSNFERSWLGLVLYPFCTLIATQVSIRYIIWLDPSLLVFLTSLGLLVGKYWSSKSPAAAQTPSLRALEAGLVLILGAHTDLKTLLTPSILLTHSSLAIIAFAHLKAFDKASQAAQFPRSLQDHLASSGTAIVSFALPLLASLLPVNALYNNSITIPISVVPIFPDVKLWQQLSVTGQWFLIGLVALPTTWACIRRSSSVGWTVNISVLSLCALAQDYFKSSGSTRSLEQTAYLLGVTVIAAAITFANVKEHGAETSLPFETPVQPYTAFTNFEDDSKLQKMETSSPSLSKSFWQQDLKSGEPSSRPVWISLAAYAILLLLTIGSRSKGAFDWKSIDTRSNTKWIIVTSIALPTDVMDHYCALKDWEVVVVADTKTPKEWHDGACHFLSIDDQYRLPFNTPRYIPYRAYTRKNLGYLYAIALGAETIFDTDDDNDVTGTLKILDPDDPHYETVFTPHMKVDTVINPYKHFGRQDIWPRGYPLDQINAHKNYSLAPTSQIPEELAGRALVLQGLADLDPDVDAIFRLTNPEDIATVHFDKTATPVKLARGVASPFNSQNTLWHKDAFWGMLLPITVTFRATDIMRGYWCQRLLWDIGATLAFGPPTVDQVRNAHDYISDMESELDLYIHVGEFITFLQTWTSTQNRLDNRIIDLGRSMVKAGHFKQPDLDLMEAWISDLRQLNYQFPEVKAFDLDAAAVAAESKAPDYHSVAQRWQETALDPTWPKFDRTLLICQFNYQKYSALAPFLNLYKRFFPNIVFYGSVPYHDEELGVDVNFVENWTAGQGGGLSYKAAIAAYRENPGYDSYLFTNDDVIFNPFAVQKLDNSKIWHPKWQSELSHVKYSGDDGTAFRDASRFWHWWGTEVGSRNAVAAIQSLNAAQPGRMKEEAWSNQGDIYSVPGQYAEEVFGMLETFANQSVWLEVAVATVFANMDSSRVDHSIPDGASKWSWMEDRLRYAQDLDQKMQFYHPLKMAGKRLDVEPNVPLGVAQAWLLESWDNSK